MTSDATSELDLLQASLKGNREAFGAIVGRYQSLVCAITYSGTGNLAQSQDLAQEVFVKAWKDLGQLRDLSKFRAWLSTITRNLVRKSIRKKQGDVIEAAVPWEDVKPVESIEQGPVEAAISKEEEAMIWETLKSIPPQFREPLVLYYRQQQSLSEVAACLGLSEDAVKQRLSRGRKLLKAKTAALVEEIIGRTGPSKAFRIAVVAALPAIAPQIASAAIAGVISKGSVAAKSAGLMSLIAGLLGPLLGLLGLLGASIGIRASITNTKSPRERTFMKRRARLAILYCSAGMLVMLILNITGPRWLTFTWFAFFLASVFTLAFLTNRRQRAIQVEDGTYVRRHTRQYEMTKGQIYGSFGGGIFGSLLWLHLMSVRAKDWFTVWAILIAGIFIFLAATKLYLRAKQHRSLIEMGVFVMVGLVNLAVVNLRWQKWVEVVGSHLKYKGYTLQRINIIIVAVIVSLLIMSLLTNLIHRRIRKDHQEPDAQE